MSNLMTSGAAGTAPRVQSFRAVVEALAPATDSVVLWLTPTVEQDFQDRDVFPEFRSARAVATRNASGWALHFLTSTQAALVLADATKRVLEVPGGLMNAYHGHERRLRAAMKEAVERQVLFSAPVPTPRHRRNEPSERWLGTKAQLKGLGIKVFPGEAGAKPRKLRTVDRRGYWTSVCASALLWPGLFEVEIGLPMAATSPVPAQQSNSPDLSRLPESADALRTRLLAGLSSIGDLAVRAMQAKIGYRYTPDAVDAFREAIEDAYEVLKHGTIVGRSRAQEIQHAAAVRAKADQPLQAFLKLVRDCPPESEI